MLGKSGVGAFTLLAFVAWSGAAAAFCRTTTCETCAQPAGACVLEGTPLFWAGNCITYDVQKTDSIWATYEQTKTAADSAFAAWQGATCADGSSPSFRVMNLGPVACDRQEYNDETHTFGGNADIIMFHDGQWPDNEQVGPGLIALTTVSFDVKSGQIFDADIEINGHNEISADTVVPANAYDLLSILTHETGHFLGLAHATMACHPSLGDCPSMSPMYPQGSDDFRSLAPDDIEGICTIYPAGRTISDDQCVPRHGFSSDCGSTTKPGGCCAMAPGSASRSPDYAAAAGLTGLALFFLRRRRA